MRVRISSVFVHHNSAVRRDTLIDFFDDLAGARGDFLVHDDGFRSHTFTYAEVGARRARVCRALHAAGLRKGDKVVFFSENRPEWIVAFWGCLLIGVVVVPIDYRASPDFLAASRRIVSARLIARRAGRAARRTMGHRGAGLDRRTASGGAEPAVSIWS